jgi:anti-sigma regulatory factor (Ser/Thr protein kinase)
MMEELSLNILDIAQNSIAADAVLVEIDIEENDIENTLLIRVKDDGKGMDEELLKTVENPFTTTRSTRKVGLGISFFKEAAEMTGGSIEITSTPGVGTTISGLFVRDHIDRQPIGDIAGTVIALVTLNTGIDFGFRYKVNENEFLFSTKEVKTMLGDDEELNKPAIVSFLTEYLNEHINALHE